MAFIPLKRRARVQYGLGQPPQLSDDGVAIIRATNIFRGRIVDNDLIRARIEDLPLDRAPLLKPGEVLVVRSGAYTGDSALVTSEWAGSAPGYDLRVTPGHDLEPRFLAYTMLGRRAMDEIDLAKSRAAQPHLNAEDLGQVGVLDIPISSQRATVNYLDRETARIDTLAATKRRMVSLLEERMRLISYDLTSKDGDVMPLRRLIRAVKTGTTPPAEEFSRLSNGSIHWYSPGDVGEWMHLSQPSRTLKAEAIIGGWVPQFPSQSTLLVGIGATAGKIAFLDHIASGNQQMTCLAPGPRVAPRFLAWQLFARRDEIRATAPFTTLPIINNEFVKSLPMVVPSLAKQAEIVIHLDLEAARVHAIARRAERQVALLQEHRQSLITAAVTGNLDV